MSLEGLRSSLQQAKAELENAVGLLEAIAEHDAADEQEQGNAANAVATVTTLTPPDAPAEGDAPAAGDESAAAGDEQQGTPAVDPAFAHLAPPVAQESAPDPSAGSVESSAGGSGEPSQTTEPPATEGL